VNRRWYDALSGQNRWLSELGLSGGLIEPLPSFTAAGPMPTLGKRAGFRLCPRFRFGD